MREAIEAHLEEYPEASNEAIQAAMEERGLDFTRGTFKASLNNARGAAGITDFVLRDDDNSVALLVHIDRETYESAVKRRKRVGPWLVRLLREIVGDPDS